MTTITVLWPIPRETCWISSTWQNHLDRPNYSRDYAGTDLASNPRNIRPSQFNGKIIQAMWSTLGYGWTTFVEYAGILRIRNAHQKNVAVSVGQIVDPKDSLGTLDSTGNSSGNHTHWEVWVKYKTGWLNIDPLNPMNEIQIVNDINLLVPLDETEPGETPVPQFTLPEFSVLPKCRTSSYITQYINIRSYPGLSGKVLGKMNLGEAWDLIDYSLDTLGNYWFAVKRNKIIGWAAAYYNGVQWIEVIS